MSWGLVLSLAAFSYAIKALGALVLGGRPLPATLQRCLLLIPAALLSALIAKDTFTSGHHIVLDARVLGLAVAAVLSWRKMPFAVVVFAGVGSVALLRLVA
jgi:branched-subunit amino acid transport protein